MTNSIYRLLGLAPLSSALLQYKTPMLVFSIFDQQSFWLGLLIFATLLTWALVFVGGLFCTIGHGAGKYGLLFALPLSVPVMMLSFIPFAFSILPVGIPILAVILAYLINFMVVLSDVAPLY